MTGLINSPTSKVIPTCRYGHGNLGRIVLASTLHEPRGMYIPTFQDSFGKGTILSDGNGYTVIMYRCPTCGYIELFDDGVVNG